MRITGADSMMKTLVDLGVRDIFGYPGGAIMPAYDALYHYKGELNHILVRHEQGAVHAAEGYARMMNRPGVCMATSGPGATNLVTGIADAMMDSIPLLCITGQVPANLIGSDAFQETDVIGITSSITKWNFQVTEASEIPEILAKAYHIAQSGRPGPVVVDITKNAQFEEVAYEFPKSVSIPSYNPTSEPNIRQIKNAAKLINNAERPYMIVGHGVQIAQAYTELRSLVEKAGIPVASTLHGLSAMPSAHPQYVGWVGMHGNYGPNVLTNKADVLIAVGMRFDDRVTGKLSEYAKHAKVIHIDVDPAELNKNVSAEIPIVADAKKALATLTKYVEKKDHTKWRNEFKAFDAIEYEKSIKPETEPQEGQIKMGEVIRVLSEKTKGESVIVPDVGQHQMIAAQYYKFQKQNSIITSGGLGTMGFSLPAAMGAKVAVPDREVIAVVGDGSFQMTMQELATIYQDNIPVKVIILNNNYLGMVRQWQQLFFEERYSFTNLKNPDFVQIAKACSLDAERVVERKDLSGALDRMLTSEKAYVLEVVVQKEHNVFPFIPGGASIEDIRLE
jgi:acetolactate synthase-1/2/3 large subunit